MIQRPNATIQLFLDVGRFSVAKTHRSTIVWMRWNSESPERYAQRTPGSVVTTTTALYPCRNPAVPPSLWRVWLKHGDMCGFQKYWSMTWAIWQFCLGWVPRLITTGATSYRQMAQSIQVLGDPGHLLNSPTHPETGAGDCFKSPWCKLESAHSKLGKKHVKRQSSQELAGLDRGVWIKKRKSNHVWKDRWAWFLKGTKVAHDCSCKYPCIKKYFWCAAKFVAWLCEELKILSQFSKGEQRDILP